MITLSDKDYLKLTDALYSMKELMEDSHGVIGLHLNGDIAIWSSLRKGGQFEEHLIAVDIALDIIEERILSKYDR